MRKKVFSPITTLPKLPNFSNGISIEKTQLSTDYVTFWSIHEDSLVWILAKNDFTFVDIKANAAEAPPHTIVEDF